MISKTTAKKIGYASMGLVAGLHVSAGVARAADAGASAASGNSVEELIVTAQKREERLQDVPAPVTALSGADLVEANQLRLQDIVTRAPGLNIVPSTYGAAPALAIRGIFAGGGNPTTSILIDDVPYGSTTILGGGLTIADIDPNDIERIEVLRGPQGTLYGANSVGGLVKYVTRDPSVERVSGHLQVGTEGVADGDGLGYNFRGAVNLPINDSLAVRVSAFTRKDPGYIDNIISGQKDVNESTVSGTHVSALWKPNQDVSLKVSAIYQDARTEGPVTVNPTLPGLKTDHVPNADKFRLQSQIYSAVLRVNLGFAELTSLTGYNVNDFNNFQDQSSGLGSSVAKFFPVNGAIYNLHPLTKKFTQELRLTGTQGHLDWIAGAYYTHEHAPAVEAYLAADTATGRIVGTALGVNEPSTLSEYAVFGDVTYHFTDRLDLQVGARESHNRQTQEFNYSGPLAQVFFRTPAPFSVKPPASKDSSFTYLITPKFTINPDLMVYARVATGYTPGGPQVSHGRLDLPPFGPEKTYNYEVGLKGEFFDRRLSIDASLYRVDWKYIQIQIFDLNTFSVVYTNGSGARSQGVELSVDARPLPDLQVGGWVAVGDATLTQALPIGATFLGLNTAAGDRLPEAMRVSGTAYAEQTFRLADGWDGDVGATVSYIGDRVGQFASTGARQSYPSYVRTDLHAGVKRDSWSLNLFVNNVANTRGIVNGTLTDTPPFRVYITPRTVGLNIAKEF